MRRSDLQNLSEIDLFTKLQSFGLPLESQRFISLSQEFETPEELAEHLTDNWEQEHSSMIYFYLFELWRRLLPQKRSLSVFCAELDKKISAQNSDLSDELATLAKILQTSVDEGVDPQKAFKAMQLYFEHDVENFLYDFILGQIENSNASYAKELIEEYIAYVQDPLWFDYLHARAVSSQDPEEGFLKLEKVILICSHKEDLEINLEILQYLAENGHSLFVSLANKTLPLIKEQEDMEDFLKVVAKHFATIEHQQKLAAVQKMIEKNRTLGPSKLSFKSVLMPLEED